jgi:hypothetical protein
MGPNSAQQTTKEWHVGHWPPLAWVETAIKAAALVIGIYALFVSLSAPSFAVPGGLRLVQFVVLGFLSLGLVAAIFDRLTEREVVAMVFVVFNNLGHWGMVAALASKAGPGSLLVAFCALMLIGDLVKLIFLKVHAFTVRDTPRSVLFGLTSIYGVGYAVVLGLELLR